MKGKIKGFTLVEFLVVVAIIAILAVVGVTVFRNVTTSARDAQRKADLNAISKAYEVKYSSAGSYSALATTDFAAGKIPKTPEGNNYPCLVGPETSCITQATDRVAYCASLGDNQSAPCYSNSSTCFCSSSTQGSSLSEGGGGGSGGGYGGSNPSCDPYGILTSGLVGYWKLDEASWNGTSNDVIDSSGQGNNLRAYGAANTLVSEKAGFGRMGDFDGISKVVQSTTTVPSLNIEGLNPISISIWMKPLGLPPVNGYTRSLHKERYVSGTDRGGYAIHIWSTATVTGGYSFHIYNNGVGEARGNGTLNINEWVHLVATYNGSNQMKIYKNGVDATTPGYGNWTTGIGTHSTGTFKIGGTTYFNGPIEDVRVYNRALSPSEIAALYNNGNGCVP
ncbi:MAG: LamG-like jellyroll fold domain-containing protein [Microgenomates group bacterium]|jgi:prepilin-type N-terminal cleavage/methylation domain-containing protein